MDADTASRVFEPFFTTKSAGTGSGLGLATVYGIVKRAGGFIRVDSARDRGTSFSIYLPQTELPAKAPAGRPLVTRPIGHERVLIIEDADPVRALAATVLQRSGYEVLDVPSGEAAERLFADDGFEVDLVLSDIVLKGMSGPQFAERLRTLRPSTRVLFMSGYADDTVLAFGAVDVNRSFLQKPFTPESLASKVRDVLDAPVRSAERLTMGGQGKLIVFCGKMAAGKSTLSKALAEQEQAVLLVQDEWLAQLFPGEILDVLDYIEMLGQAERGPGAAHRVTAVERHLGRARLSRQHHEAARVVPPADSRPPASSTSSISSTRPTTSASVSCANGAPGSLPARRGPRRPSSTPSRRTSSRRPPMRAST